MSDEERYEVLKEKKINLSAATDFERAKRKLVDGVSIEEYFSENKILFKDFKATKNLLIKIGDEFGVFKSYNDVDFGLSVRFSRGNLKHSAEYQKKNYALFVKMLSCFDKVIENAIGIEVHNRNNKKYKTDPTLSNIYVLVSVFEDGDQIVPVKLEIKEFNDKDNTLYVAIALEGIKKDEVITQGDTENGVTQYAHSSNISIADLFRNVNPIDGHFLKYLPDQFLSKEQIESKYKALSEDKASEVTGGA